VGKHRGACAIGGGKYLCPLRQGYRNRTAFRSTDDDRGFLAHDRCYEILLQQTQKQQQAGQQETLKAPDDPIAGALADAEAKAVEPPIAVPLQPAALEPESS
jgi:hypothetical protein